MIQQKVHNSDQIVKLNVGGTPKLVSKALLTSVKDSLLAKTFSGKHNLKMIDGHIFLDRDPSIFDMVLNYLRYDGTYMPQNLDAQTKTLYVMEVDYWGIGPKKYIETKFPQDLLEMLKTNPKIDISSNK